MGKSRTSCPISVGFSRYFQQVFTKFEKFIFQRGTKKAKFIFKPGKLTRTANRDDK
jgi:hypothetical protein